MRLLVGFFWVASAVWFGLVLMDSARTYLYSYVRATGRRMPNEDDPAFMEHVERKVHPD